METDAIFNGISDDEEEYTSNLPAIAAMKPKRAGAAMAPSLSKRPALLSGHAKRALEKEKQPVVTDDFGQSVEKEYEMKTGTITTAAGNEQLVVKHQVRHQVALPLDYPYIPIAQHVPLKDPARTYPFVLDPFQKTAISSIERNESVLVAAHTSAGKTVVAEYAIALSLRNKQRVIYTSPIKALSNQKYRELLAEFGDVGLMTGDVVINPDASCLVMTTEILRSMLYRGSEVMREVAWVVFDEVHYMRDVERGVVWEETLIMLPDKVHFVFLSATIPNAMQFAEWICKMHKQPCHVVFTDYRPTPLQHYLFPAGGEGIYLAVDEKGTFREDNFQKAISVIGNAEELPGEKKKKNSKRTNNKTGSDLFKLINMILKKNYHPVIVFSFSKRECESNALVLSKLDFNDEIERGMVKKVFESAILSLSEDDRSLPQIEHLLPLLQRGIGIHHSGLLPILKEVIEILFQEGLLKVLFATETFSIGLNMPAKTVMFTSVRKFDGKEQRWLTGGEYVQMSGRAGRRGLDERGVVILMIDEKMEPTVAKVMLKGISDPLNSAFHLTYTMILNLMRVDGITPEFILESSFYQFQNCAKLPQLSQEILVLEKRRQALKIDREDEVYQYYQTRKQLELYNEDMRHVLNHPTYCLPFVQPGRLVRIRLKVGTDNTEYDFSWGIVVNFRKTYQKNPKGDMKSVAAGPTYVLDVLLHCVAGTEQQRTEPRPCISGVGDMVVIACPLSAIDGLSSARIFVPKEIKSVDSRQQILKTVLEILKRFPDGPPLLDPVRDMQIKDESFVKLVEKIEILKRRMAVNEVANDTRINELFTDFESKVMLGSKIDGIKKEIAQAEAVLQLDELKCRRRVLRRLGYLNEAGVIELKGRVACELSCGDELLLTELIFAGFFTDLPVEIAVALLSCFVCEERVANKPVLREELDAPFKELRSVAKKIALVSIESKIELNEQDYIARFNESMMDVVYAWAQGSKFSEICKMTEIFEGSIIRIFRRLYELLQELITASKCIGNEMLEDKFTQCSIKLKRDIVFAASLYL